MAVGLAKMPGCMFSIRSYQGCRADRGNRATGNAPFPDHLALDIPEGSAAFARQGQRRFARSENHGLENSGSVCHVEAEMIGGVP